MRVVLLVVVGTGAGPVALRPALIVPACTGATLRMLGTLRPPTKGFTLIKNGLVAFHTRSHYHDMFQSSIAIVPFLKVSALLIVRSEGKGMIDPRSNGNGSHDSIVVHEKLHSRWVTFQGQFNHFGHDVQAGGSRKTKAVSSCQQNFEIAVQCCQEVLGGRCGIQYDPIASRMVQEGMKMRVVVLPNLPG